MPILSDEWKAREDYTNDFFPIRTTPVARRGRFAWVVLQAYRGKVISADTVATLLATDVDTLDQKADEVMRLAKPGNATH
jgi:hypothetical protein